MSSLLVAAAKARRAQKRPAAPPLTMLLDEEQDFQKEIRRFAEKEIKPQVSDMDTAAEMPRGLIDQLFELGVLGSEVPDALGGAGASFFSGILAIEELAKVDPAVAVLVHVHNVLVTKTLLKWGSDDLKARYLPLLTDGTVAAYSLSEAESGSDAFAMKSTAVRRGDYFVLDGRKLWCTSAAEAGLFLIFVNAAPEKGVRGITGFLVERDTEGLQIGRREDKMGIRASSTCELVLDGVKVPAKQMLGTLGSGQDVITDGLVKGRIGIAAQMVGLAQGALDAAVAYAHERRQFGQRISSFQGVHFPLSEIATEIEAARLLVYNAARLLETGAPHFKLSTPTSMAKLFASRVAERAASQAVETLGGNGFSKEYPVEKFYRDAKIGQIYEGTSNIQLRTIATGLFQRL